MKQKYAFWITALMIGLFSITNVSAQVNSGRVVTSRKVDATRVVKEKPKKEKTVKEKPQKEKTVKEKPEKPPREKTIYAPVDKRWYNTVRLQYGLNIAPGIHYQGNYRFNKWFELGVGIGYEYTLMSWVNYGLIHTAPLYANVRFYFMGEKRVNPFVGFSQGLAISYYKMMNGWEHPEIAYWGAPDYLIIGERLRVGSHTRIEIGGNFRINPKNSLKFSIEGGIVPISRENGYYDAVLSINFGFTF